MDYPPPLVTINSNDEIDLQMLTLTKLETGIKQYPVWLPNNSKSADEAVAFKKYLLMQPKRINVYFR
jgi:hypothetical protein